SFQWSMEWSRQADLQVPAAQLARPAPIVHHGLPSSSRLGEQPMSATPAAGPSPSPRKPTCAVCGDTALGKHYGVMACNGCKGFFRRTVWKERKYKCRAEGECAIDMEQRNSCRACRYTTCLRVGMNPRAVQGDLNECRKNGVICTLPKEKSNGRARAREEEEEQPRVDDSGDDESPSEVKPPMTSSIATQTAEDDDPIVMAKEINELVNRFKRVCDRWEEPTVVRGGREGRWSILSHEILCGNDDSMLLQKPITETVRVPFEMIYKHPELVCARTKLDPSASRVATLEEILGDYRRTFVLYADLMHATPEVMAMEESDQILMAKKSFGAFYWTMSAFWATSSDKTVQGVCYANGTYFPTDKKQQRFPDDKDCASRAVFYLNEPVRALALTEKEQAVIAYLACFIDGVPKLSPDGCRKYSEMRDRLIRYLYELAGSTRVAGRGLASELAVAGRVSRIISLYPSITDLVMRASDNMEVSDVLQTIKFDTWMCQRDGVLL
ncbi:hypothetical protein PMAYCL1PPCAC_06146, partial [Pristionchus mayeri]